MQAVDVSLMASAAALGLAGIPHCAAMCTAPCAAATAGQGVQGSWAFHAARLASYSLAGAVAAASVGALSGLSQAAPVLRPLWTLLHVAALGLGLWLLCSGRQPAWLGRLGRSGLVQPAQAATVQGVVGSGVAMNRSRARGGPTMLVRGAAALQTGSAGVSAAIGGASSRGSGSIEASTPAASRLPWRAAMAGALWAAWPCGLLQSALLVAGLTGGAAAGASAMALFAFASSGGLVLGPWAWRRWLGAVKPADAVARRRASQRERWLVRAGGAMLVLASSWSLGHGMWMRVAVWCGLA